MPDPRSSASRPVRHVVGNRGGGVGVGRPIASPKREAQYIGALPCTVGPLTRFLIPSLPFPLLPVPARTTTTTTLRGGTAEKNPGNPTERPPKALVGRGVRGPAGDRGAAE